MEGGVPRVNGDLAVSRCFGDADYKKTGVFVLHVFFLFSVSSTINILRTVHTECATHHFDLSLFFFFFVHDSDFFFFLLFFLQQIKTGDMSTLENRPVTANPEMDKYECNADDFLLLVCDGVSE
jgi:serine/threonine protein phosphatase PrpC